MKSIFFIFLFISPKLRTFLSCLCQKAENILIDQLMQRFVQYFMAHSLKQPGTHCCIPQRLQKTCSFLKFIRTDNAGILLPGNKANWQMFIAKCPVLFILDSLHQGKEILKAVQGKGIAAQRIRIIGTHNIHIGAQPDILAAFLNKAVAVFSKCHFL